MSSVRNMATLMPQAARRPANLDKSLPDGVQLEALTCERHDVSQLRQLIARVFSLTEEPIIEALCRYHYPDATSVLEKLHIAEEMSKVLFAEDELAKKINEGLSSVAVLENDPDHYVGVAFVEAFKGPCSLLHDTSVTYPFHKDARNFLNAVHAMAAPVLAAFPQGEVAYLSHGATSPEYQTYGITAAMMNTILARLVQRGFKAAYSIVTNEWAARAGARDLGFNIVAEIKYKDYEDADGRKVFAGAPANSKSIKAMMKLL